MDFFFLGGILAAIIGEFRKLSLVILAVFWVIFIFILPEAMYTFINQKAQQITSAETVNLKKIKVLLDHENMAKKSLDDLLKKNKDINIKEIWKNFAYEFLENGYVENKKRETELYIQTRKLSESLKYFSWIFPGNFYLYLSGETSSGSYKEYSRYLKYIIDLRDKFFRYYLRKRYESNDEKVRSFLKIDENVFKAKSRLPGNFWAGFCLTVLYCLILFGVTFIIIHVRLNKRIKDRERVDFDFSETERGRFYFVLCKDDDFRDRLFHQLSLEPGVVGLDQVRGEDIDPELPPGDIVPYFCHLWEVKDIEKANAVAEQLGIEEIKYFKYKKSREVGEEDLKKLYAAVLLTGAAEGEIILINDFLAGVKRTFEHKFIAVLQEFIKQDKTVVYLSTEMFMSVSASKFNELDADMDFDIQEVDLEYISLR
jgi:hypothetical protein